jgi:hypothetical protein
VNSQHQNQIRGDIYITQIDNMVKNVIDGFHSTIFCYGQTGSGKTYSMDGYKYKRSEKGVYLPIIDDASTNNGETYGLV